MYDLTHQQHDYPHWCGSPARTIVVCTQPRSGSTLLGEALFFAEGLGCPLEYFHLGLRPRLQQLWQLPDLGSYTRAVHERRTAPNGTFAVKLMWRDLEDLAHELRPEAFGPHLSLTPETTSAAAYREIFQLLAPLIPNPVFLHLYRRDVLRQAISAHFAIESGGWRHIPGVEAQAPRKQPGYSYDRITSLAAMSRYINTHWTQFFAANDIHPLQVSYETLDRDYVATIRTVFDYLGSIAPVPPVRMQRQSNTLSETFALRFLREYQTRGSGSEHPAAQQPLASEHSSSI